MHRLIRTFGVCIKSWTQTNIGWIWQHGRLKVLLRICKNIRIFMYFYILWCCKKRREALFSLWYILIYHSDKSSRASDSTATEKNINHTITADLLCYTYHRKTNIDHAGARSLKTLCTSKGAYWNKQWFYSIAPLFKMRTARKGKNSLPGGANFFL